MTEPNGANPPPGQTPDQPPSSEARQIRLQILAQYVRDLSFENVLAQRGVQGEVQPDVQVQVNLDARKRPAENQYEVILKFKITAKTKTTGETLFLIEVDYAGVFLIENATEAQLHPILLIECPRLLFPFVRRIVSDLTRDGGFPPLNIDVVDFVAIYRQELQRRAAQGQPSPALQS
jgi:preprotein translocase subunit SecB